MLIINDNYLILDNMLIIYLDNNLIYKQSNINNIN